MTKIISLNELANTLNVSRVTLYNWHKSNYLKFIKVGGRNYYKHDEIINILKIDIYDN